MRRFLIILFLSLTLAKPSFASEDKADKANNFIKIFDALCKSNKDDLNKIASSDYLKNSLPFSHEMMKRKIKFIIDSNTKGYLFGKPGEMMYGIVFTPKKYCVLFAMNVDRLKTEDLLIKKYNLRYFKSVSGTDSKINIYKFNNDFFGRYDDIGVMRQTETTGPEKIGIIYSMHD